MAAEKNPMLGVRGIRVGLAHPELLATQVRAILRVKGDCRIMVPMVSGVAELRAVRALVGDAAPLGVMFASGAFAHELDPTKLPLGDGRLSTAPKAGYIWACHTDPNAGGAFRDGRRVDHNR